ncbi:unnamed protein product, partial [Phaeothamnion confervicola]
KDNDGETKPPSASDLAALFRLMDGRRGIFCRDERGSAFESSLPPQLPPAGESAEVKLPSLLEQPPPSLTDGGTPAEGALPAGDGTPAAACGATAAAAASAAVSAVASAAAVAAPRILTFSGSNTGGSMRQLSGARSSPLSSGAREILQIVGRQYATIPRFADGAASSSVAAGSTAAAPAERRTTTAVPVLLSPSSSVIDLLALEGGSLNNSINSDTSESGGSFLGGGSGGRSSYDGAFTFIGMTSEQLARVAVDFGLAFADIAVLCKLFKRYCRGKTAAPAAVGVNAASVATATAPVLATDLAARIEIGGGSAVGVMSAVGWFRMVSDLGLLRTGLALSDVGMTFHRYAEAPPPIDADGSDSGGNSAGFGGFGDGGTDGGTSDVRVDNDTQQAASAVGAAAAAAAEAGVGFLPFVAMMQILAGHFCVGAGGILTLANGTARAVLAPLDVGAFIRD